MESFVASLGKKQREKERIKLSNTITQLSHFTYEIECDLIKNNSDDTHLQKLNKIMDEVANHLQQLNTKIEEYHREIKSTHEDIKDYQKFSRESAEIIQLLNNKKSLTKEEEKELQNEEIALDALYRPMTKVCLNQQTQMTYELSELKNSQKRILQLKEHQYLIHQAKVKSFSDISRELQSKLESCQKIFVDYPKKRTGLFSFSYAAIEQQEHQIMTSLKSAIEASQQALTQETKDSVEKDFSNVIDYMLDALDTANKTYEKQNLDSKAELGILLKKTLTEQTIQLMEMKQVLQYKMKLTTSKSVAVIIKSK